MLVTPRRQNYWPDFANNLNEDNFTLPRKLTSCSVVPFTVELRDLRKDPLRASEVAQLPTYYLLIHGVPKAMPHEGGILNIVNRAFS